MGEETARDRRRGPAVITAPDKADLIMAWRHARSTMLVRGEKASVMEMAHVWLTGMHRPS